MRQDTDTSESFETKLMKFSGDMLSFFRPAIDRITKLLQQQIDAVESEASESPINV